MTRAIKFNDSKIHLEETEFYTGHTLMERRRILALKEKNRAKNMKDFYIKRL